LKVFIDASALVAIIAREPDHLELQKRLKRHRRKTISALVVYETTLALTRIGGVSLAEAQELVMQFKKTFAVQEVSIELKFAATALEAFRRYGRGQGHKARLNMGDCFTYACATVLNVPLLFKGDDFIHTDVSIA
jgi:ribonuclease VapC